MPRARSRSLGVALLLAAILMCFAAPAIAREAIPATPLHSEGRCPGRCGGKTRGICTRHGCACFEGHGGAACDEEAKPETLRHKTPLGLGSPFGAPLKVCVASAQVPHTSLSEGPEVAIPGFALALDLASSGHLVTLVFLALNGGPRAEDEAAWRAGLLRDHNVRLVVLTRTQHYYMPASAAQSFELLAYVRDRALHFGGGAFDLIACSGGHGLSYYLSLSRGQDPVRSGVEGTAIAEVLEAPHLWLVTRGGGGGVTSVDDVEIDFMEREAARMADAVHVPLGEIRSWCKRRGWAFPRAGGSLLSAAELETKAAEREGVAPISSEWRSVGLGSAAGTRAAGGSGGVRLILALQGPGGGRQGEMVSSGGNRRAGGVFRVSEDHKHDATWADLAEAEEVALALASANASEKGGGVLSLASEVVLLVAGLRDGEAPYQLKRSAQGAVETLMRAAPHLKVGVRFLGRGEAEGWMREGRPRQVVVALARRHRDALTLRWLEEVAGCDEGNTVYLTAAEAAREVLGRELGGAPDGRMAAIASEAAVIAAGLLGGSGRFGSGRPRARQRRLARASFGLATAGLLAQGGGLGVSSRPGPSDGQRQRLAASTSFGVVRLLVGPTGPQVAGCSPEMDVFARSLALPKVTVVITHYNRPNFLVQAVASITRQSYPPSMLELLVVDDGSTAEGARQSLRRMELEFGFERRGWRVMYEPNRYLGGARNAGFAASQGKYVLFMDDDNYAKSYEVEALVRAAEGANADALTSGLDFVTGKGEPGGGPRHLEPRMGPTPKVAAAEPGRRADPIKSRTSPSFVFLGASRNVGLFKNCFGDANSFFRSSSFAEFGGYTEDRNVGYEDWELYSKLAMAGYDLQTVPRAMYFYRFTSGSMQKTTSYRASRRRALRAYKTHV